MKRTRRPSAIALAAAFLLALTLLAVPSAAFAAHHEPTYRVTIENLTDGQWLTPGAAVVHYRNVNIFRMNRPASYEIKEIAENGNTGPALTNWSSLRRAEQTVMVGGGAIAPGASMSSEFSVPVHRGRRISLAAMLICSNDGFAGVRNLDLPRRIGQVRTTVGRAYDAGTEINTESFDDLVPPCPVLTGVDTDEAGTGVSNPALAENGVVRRHGGITGVDDLDPALVGFTQPAIRVTVERIG